MLFISKLKNFVSRFYRVLKPSRRIRVILQVHPQECGVSCLCMILEYHGVYKNPHILRSLCGINRNGASISQIQQGVDKLGYHCFIKKLGLKVLENIGRPIIIHWNMNHFVVLESINTRSAWIIDPALGRRKVSINEFKNAYTGICLFVDIPDCTNKKSKKNFINFPRWSVFERKLFNQYFLGGVILFPIFLIVFFEYIFALSSLFVFDYVVSQRMERWGYYSFIIVIVSILGFYICYRLLNEYILKLSFNQASKVRAYVTKKVTSHTISYFKSVYPIELVNNIYSLTYYCKERIQFTYSILISTLLLLLSFIVISLLNPLLASIVILPHFIQTIWMFLKRYEIREFEMGINKSNNEYIQSSQLRSDCYDRYFSMGMEKHLVMSAIPIFLKMQASKELLTKFLSVHESFKISTNTLSFPILIYSGSYMVTLGINNFGEVLLLLGLSILFNSQMSNLYRIVRSMLALKPTAQCSVELICDEVSTSHNFDNLLSSNELIVVKNLSFTHELGDSYLFNNIQASVKRCEIVCVSGPTGCGKTTFLELLIGKYEPQSGFIGKRINSRDENVDWSVIFANDTLMPVSVSQFISGSNIPKLQLVEESLKLVELDKRLGFFLRGDNKEDLMSLGLSRGEVHRLLIARSIYSNPELIIIDEAFSSISTNQAVRIIERIRDKCISVVLATHRDEIKELCDNVIHLNTA